MRMAVLADAVSHSRSRVTHTIARMERAGLVERVPCAEDGRGVMAVLTEQGYDALVAAAPTHVSGVRRYLVDVATAEDFAAVGRVFDAVSDGLVEGNPAADLR